MISLLNLKRCLKSTSITEFEMAEVIEVNNAVESETGNADVHV